MWVSIKLVKMRRLLDQSINSDARDDTRTSGGSHGTHYKPEIYGTEIYEASAKGVGQWPHEVPGEKYVAELYVGTPR